MSNRVVNKPEILALYQKTANEINRYRDLEWKIAIWTLSLLVGIISLTRFVLVTEDYKQIFQVLLGIFILVATLFSIWHIHFCHRNLTINRQVHRKCELELQIDDFLPDKWKKEPKKIKYTQGIIHLISWFILIIITSMLAIYCIYAWA